MIAALLGSEEFNGTSVTIALVASVGLILLNGFYVAYEFAVLAAKRSSFEDDRRSSAAARTSLADVSMQLAGAQLGITIASLALGRISEPALEVIIERILGDSVSPEVARGLGITIALAVFTILHLVFGEMVPKNIALVAPEATLRWLVIPYRIYLFLFRPVVQLLNGVANLCARAVGIEPRDELKSVHTASELAAIVADATEGGTIDADDAEMLRGALDFAQRPVSEIATPLGHHPSVNLGATVGQLERAVANTGEGRILVLDSRLDSAPVGYVHVRDLLHIEAGRRRAPVPPDFVRNMAVVRADRPLVEVLLQLRSLKQYLAVVTDEAVPIGVVSQEQVVRAIIQPPAQTADEPARRSG
ncbi:MAG: CNNM domain-containing protein [Acidimicrobiales bacterium]